MGDDGTEVICSEDDTVLELECEDAGTGHYRLPNRPHTVYQRPLSPHRTEDINSLSPLYALSKRILLRLVRRACVDGVSIIQINCVASLNFTSNISPSQPSLDRIVMVGMWRTGRPQLVGKWSIVERW